MRGSPRDQSKDTSVEDQVVERLRRAARDGYFVPFELVFADFSMSGLSDDPPGYDGVRHVMQCSCPAVEHLYISEFSRASRDEREWQNLYFLSRANQKVMIGALDGFDSSSEDAEERIANGSYASRQEKTQRVQAIRRGRLGALRRGTSLGHPPIGFTRRQAVDANGNLRTKRNGVPIFEWVIDPMSEDIVLLIFDLFVERKWSLARIARHLNEKHADGRTSWKANVVKQILENSADIGILIRHRYRDLRDPKSGMWARISNPRSRWVIFYRKDCILVPKQTQRRLAELRRASKLTGRKWSRTERNSKSPFDGQRFCSCCDCAVTRSRSGQHAQCASVNGQTHSHGCQLRTSKSVRLVEQCLLEFIKVHLLGDGMVEFLVRLANERLTEAARREASDPEVIGRRRDKRQAEIDNLLNAIGEANDVPVRARLNARIGQVHALLLEDNRELETVLAQRVGKSVLVVTDALNFHFQGTVPIPRSQRPQRQCQPRRSIISYKEIANEVQRLRDVEEQSFQNIAKSLGTSRSVVERAYQFGRQQAVQSGMEVAKPLKRAAQFPKRTLDVIRELWDSDMTAVEIVRRADCSHQTVARYCARYAREQK